MSSVEAQDELVFDKHLPRYKCCCLHIQVGAYIIAFVSAFFIVSNFLMKLTGHSETAWDWELLFLVVDSIAVASFMFGVYSERAAFLQPFVILSIITISFLILLVFYCGSAVYDPHSYAGESLEVQFHEHLTNIAHHFSLELKHMVSISAGICAIILMFSVSMHCWFVILTVKCAKYFRELHSYKMERSKYETTPTTSRSDSKRVKAKTSLPNSTASEDS